MLPQPSNRRKTVIAFFPRANFACDLTDVPAHRIRIPKIRRLLASVVLAQETKANQGTREISSAVLLRSPRSVCRTTKRLAELYYLRPALNLQQRLSRKRTESESVDAERERTSAVHWQEPGHRPFAPASALAPAPQSARKDPAKLKKAVFPMTPEALPQSTFLR